MLIKLPGSKVAVNPEWVTCVVDNSDALDYYKAPRPHITVHWCYGVQQGRENLVGVTFDQVVALLNLTNPEG
jgi:hypothetical protein